jgi:protein gp37
MADGSSIEWTQATWNPTTGCDQTSPGCDNCYALTLAKRLKAMGSQRYQIDGDPRTSGPGFRLTLHDEVIDLPRRWRSGRLVFVNSMSDLFHPDVPLDYIKRVFEVMQDTPRHTYQVLTKRSRRLADLAGKLEWSHNIWMGVSVECSRYRFRVRHLQATGAAIKFISAEPIIAAMGTVDLAGIQWVIAGGESGPRARPMDPAWVRDLRDQCTAADVDFFFKQWGGRTPKAGGRMLDGRQWNDLPQAHLVPAVG